MFIHEGQKMVCRVTVFDKEKRTIDISVKKVTQKEAKQKMGAYNLEKRLEALLNQAIKGTKSEEPNKEIEDQVFSEFGSYTNMAKAMIGNTKEFKRSKLPKKLKDPILKVLEANIKQEGRICLLHAHPLNHQHEDRGIGDEEALLRDGGIRD